MQQTDGVARRCYTNAASLRSKLKQGATKLVAAWVRALILGLRFAESRIALARLHTG